MFDLITNIKSCRELINEVAPFGLLYYSHLPTAIVSLVIGFFVFFKNRYSLISKILLGIALTFSLWSLFDLVVWIGAYNSPLLMFSWSILGIFDALFFILSLYFVYVFIDKEDVSFVKKLVFGAMLLPIVVLVPTQYNLTGFDTPNCEAIENNLVLNYLFTLEIVAFLWIIILSIHRYIKADREFRKQIFLLTTGVSLFLLSFFTTGYLADYFENFSYEIYGLFGMVIFMGFLGYLIVQYKAFNIKLLAAQALVAALVILIASQYFFVRSTTNQILTGVTLILALGFGYVLVKSVKAEVERKEQLQMMTDKLAAANDKLRELDNAKSEFISIASHQLRTPLTATKGFISMLLEGAYGDVNKKHEEILNKVYIANERLITLVEDLLNLSRIESGRIEYNFEKTDLAGVCREIFDTFVIRAKDKKLSFKLDIAENFVAEAMTDRNKVREVMSNLVDNAIKYTPKGSVKMELADRGEFVRFSVKDSGVGVAKEDLENIFGKFSRGRDSSKVNVSGTGLGLHVGRSMIEALQGKIGVESEGTGKGSTFWVDVPREVISK